MIFSKIKKRKNNKRSYFKLKNLNKLNQGHNNPQHQNKRNNNK